MLPYKNYKADLKGKYEKYLKVSFILTLLLVIAAFKFSPKSISIKDRKQNNDNDIIFIQPEVNTIIDTKPPVMPKPVVPVIAVNDQTEDLVMVDVSIDKTKANVSFPDTERRIKIEDDQVFIAVEKMPELIGGMKSLYSKLYYPEIARRTGIEGKVIIECIIDKNGNVESAEVVSGVVESIDQMSLDAVKKLKFHPGEQRGKPVRVKMKIPIDFKLK